MFSNNLFNTNINNLIPSPLGSLNKQVVSTLGLNQISGFQPTQKFKDETNTEWTLVKCSSDSTVDIPDPKSMQIVDYWNHEFPNIKSKLYIYVVEGIRQPRVETEQASRILYQWFSTVYVHTFTPQMITDKEWLKANVYAAPIINGRVSKLCALCKVSGDVNSQVPTEDKLIDVSELNGNNTGNSE